MKYLSQRDPQWAYERLGESTLTIGRFGCTTTCISMLSSLFNCYQTPVTIAHNANNYTKDGLVLWQNLKFDSMRFVRREYGRHDISIKEALKDPRKAVILEVNNRAHWVVALRPALLGSGYIVLDPWTGKKCGVLFQYHNITGAAYFERV